MIGIYCRYGHRPSAYMALSLASHLGFTGEAVTVRSGAPITSSIDSRWDVKVARAYDDNAQWLKKCDSVVWFGFDAELLRRAVLGGRNNVLVATYSEIGPGYVAAAQNVDAVVCTSGQLRASIDTIWNPKRSVVIPWDTGNPLVTASQTIHDTLLVVFESAAAEAYSDRMLSALSLLMATQPDLRLSLVLYRRLPGAGYVALTNLLNDCGDRVRVYKKPTVQELRAICCNSRWVLYANRQDDVGWPVLEANCAGVPAIVFNTPAMYDCVTGGLTGRLLQTTLLNDRFGAASVASPSLPELVLSLTRCFAKKTRAAFSPDDISAQVEQRRRAFHKSWQNLLQLAAAKG